MPSRSVIKRLELLEQRRNIEETPSLIMISYDEVERFWGVKEISTSKDKSKTNFKEITYKLDKLQDYRFKPEYKSRVIMETYSNPDPDIYATLLCFDSVELWQDFGNYKGCLCIKEIRACEGTTPRVDMVIEKIEEK